MTELKVDNLTVTAKSASLLEGATFTLRPGELVVLLGPNGAGKTTLLRGALGLQEAQSGRAFLAGQDIGGMSPMVRARQVAYLPQTRPVAWPNLVFDVVALGRYAYGVSLGRLKQDDLAAVERALAACDITHLASRRMDTLSGGEVARVHCARAFAAEAPLMVADEPVAALDPRHQFRVMDIVRDFVDGGGGALIVLHDVALAARYADRMIWMKQGRIIADGKVVDTLTEARMAEIYAVRAKIQGRTVQIEGTI